MYKSSCAIKAKGFPCTGETFANKRKSSAYFNFACYLSKKQNSFQKTSEVDGYHYSLLSQKNTGKTQYPTFFESSGTKAYNGKQFLNLRHANHDFTSVFAIISK